MNTVDYIKQTLVVNGTLFGFEYRGKEGNIDPYYTNGKYLLFFDGKEKVVDSFEEVLSTPFIDGKTIVHVLEQITITES